MKTKTWKGDDRTEFSLVDYSVMQFADREKLVVARYGNSSTGLTNCVEFLVEYPVPSGEEPRLLLLAHDCGMGNVSAITPIEMKERVFIRVERVARSQNGSGSTRKSYEYEFATNNCLLLMETEIITRE